MCPSNSQQTPTTYNKLEKAMAKDDLVIKKVPSLRRVEITNPCSPVAAAVVPFTYTMGEDRSKRRLIHCPISDIHPKLNRAGRRNPMISSRYRADGLALSLYTIKEKVRSKRCLIRSPISDIHPKLNRVRRCSPMISSQEKADQPALCTIREEDEEDYIGHGLGRVSTPSGSHGSLCIQTASLTTDKGKQPMQRECDFANPKSLNEPSFIKPSLKSCLKKTSPHSGAYKPFIPAIARTAGNCTKKQKAKRVSWGHNVIHASCAICGASTEPIVGSTFSRWQDFTTRRRTTLCEHHQKVKSLTKGGDLDDIAQEENKKDETEETQKTPPSPRRFKLVNKADKLTEKNIRLAEVNSHLLTEAAVEDGHIDFIFYTCRWKKTTLCKNACVIANRYPYLPIGSYVGWERQHMETEGLLHLQSKFPRERYDVPSSSLSF